MFSIFKVKRELELQVEKYIAWKEDPNGGNAPFIAENHKEALDYFTKCYKHRKSISETTLEDYEEHHARLMKEITPYSTIKAMQAFRAFARYHKHQISFKADQIQNEGIYRFTPVAKNVIITPMIRKRRVGRPPNVVFIKRVQRLVNKEGMGIRAIARAENMNPGNVSRAYNYDLSKLQNVA